MAFTYGTITNAKGGNGQTITAYQIRLGYELQSQDIENNTSSIKLQLEVRSTNSTYKTFGYNQTTTIDGTSLAAKTFDMRSTNVWQIFGTRTITVNHNADGTYSVNKSGSFTTTATGDYSLKSGNANVDVILPTIPRASTITVNDANIGSATNIVINKANSSFTTTLYYKASGQSTFTKIVDKTANQVYGWTVPTSFYSLIPNAKTIQCQFYAETYSGSTLVGTSETVTATFTATGNPIINSCNLISTDSTTTNLVGNSRMIRYVSTVQATVNASGRNSATISSIVVNGVTANSSGIATFPNATTYSYNVIVTDSRGYTSSGTYTITWTDYIPLTINATISRNTPVDGKINISFNGNYFNSSFRKSDDTYVSNTLTVQYQSRVKGGSWSGWQTLSATKSGNTYSGSTQLSGYTYTNQYEFQIRAIDRVQTRTIEGINVSKGQPIFNWEDGKFNVNGNYYQNNTLLTSLFLSLANGGTVAGNVNFTGNLQKSGNNVATTNQIPTNNNQLTNGAGYITSSALPKVGDYANLKLTTRYTSSQSSWTKTTVSFTTSNSSFNTSSSSFFSRGTNGITCNFSGTVMIIKTLTTNTSEEIDLYNDSETTEIYNTKGENIYFSYVKTVTSGETINMKYNPKSTSFTVYEGTQMTIIRLK